MGNSYIKAYEDIDFLNRDELRAVRLQTELLKPELIMEDELILSTVCVFGSARTLDPTEAQARLHQAEEVLAKSCESAAAQEQLRLAKIAVEHSVDYARARQFAALMSRFGQRTGALEFVICTGGGPGIMEAANRGATDANAKSIGLNITLPHEQKPNAYVTPELNFLFHYFSIRKMHFMMRAKALCAFPGGFGSLDELFETLTLIQTHKTGRIPVILFNRPYWDALINWNLLVERGMIAREDLDLITYTEDPKEAVDSIIEFHGQRRNHP